MYSEFTLRLEDSRRHVNKLAKPHHFRAIYRHCRFIDRWIFTICVQEPLSSVQQAFYLYKRIAAITDMATSCFLKILRKLLNEQFFCSRNFYKVNHKNRLFTL